METLSCYSNENTWATAIKNINIVEVNVMNNTAKFQLYPPHSFSEKLIFENICLQILPIGCHGNQSN